MTDAVRGKSIIVIDAHPDRAPERLGHALADEYAGAARAGGHRVEVVRLSGLEFPWLRSAAEFAAPAPQPIEAQQRLIFAADHLVIVYPLWLGSMPALLKAYLEQVLRPGFTFGPRIGKASPKKRLAGKSSHIVVTMGMPSFVYRLYYRSHSVRSLARNILAFVGFKPVRVSLIGNVEGSASARRRAIAKLRACARRGQ